MRNRQRGMTIIGWLLVMVPIGIMVYAGIRLAPSYINYYRVVQSLSQLATESATADGGVPNVAALRVSLAKRFDVQYVDHPTPAEINFSRVDGHWVATADYEDLAPLFGPGSKAEVPLTGVVEGHVVGGLVDRLAVLPDRVLVADFKTNRRPPDSVAATPVLYLRQMALYRAVLGEIFPDRPVICALVWTRDARVAILPDEILDQHTPRPSSEAA